MVTRALVAVTHKLDIYNRENNNLLDSYCTQRAREEISHLVSDKSLLLFEGLDFDNLISPDHSQYSLLHGELESWLGETQPMFCGCDPRFTTTQKSKLSNQRYDEWTMLAAELFDINRSTKPSSLKEARDMLRESVPTPKLKRRISQKDIELARWIWSTNRKFDRRYLEKLAKNGHRFDTILFIGGAIHALSMAVHSEYTVVELINPVDVEETYYQYLMDYQWPRLLL